MKNATAFVLLAISLVVAVLNIVVGRFQYVLFAVPFFFAAITDKEKSTMLQVMGLVAVACYILANEFYLGMMTMIVTGFMVYLHYGQSRARLFIVASAIPVGLFSYLTTETTKSMVIHVTMDVFLYGLVCVFVYLVVCAYKAEVLQKNKTIDQKYIEVIDELQRVAHESIDILKQIQDEARDDRPRKNC